MVIQVNRRLGVLVIRTRFFTRIFWMPVWPFRLKRFVRGLFPSFYAVGSHCCDHGGHTRSWRPVAVWNEWHRGRIGDWGDGPDSWTQMSLPMFIKWRLWLRSRGLYSEHVDGPSFDGKLSTVQESLRERIREYFKERGVDA